MNNDDPRLNTAPFGSPEGINTGPESGPAFVSHTAGNPNQPISAPSSSADLPQPGGPQPQPSAAPSQAAPSQPTPSATDWWAPTGAPQPGPGNGGFGGPPTATAPFPEPVEGPKPGKSGGGRRLGTVLVAATLAAVVGAGAGIGTYAFSSASPGIQSPINYSTQPASQSAVLDGTVAAAAKKIKPSVVTITVESGGSGDIGTGVILDDTGHILTNNHVVEAAAQGGTITVTFADGSTAKATLVGQSESNDLAVIQVSGVDRLTPATFASNESLAVGQAVVAAGAPLGLSESVTSGIVSNLARPVRSGTNGDAVYLAVQTDAAINPGNSGGPLVDLNGSVVGINSSIAGTGSSDEEQSGNIGIGFAIPSDVATRVASEIIASGHSVDAKMGVTVGGNDLATPDTTSAGTPLQSVTSGGPAAAAGLKAGDHVTKVNDFVVTSADGLIAATRYYAPGTTINITYTRNGSTETTQLKLASV